MKAKGIPDKIYLQVCGSCEQKYCDACEFEDLEGDITWCKDKIFPNDVEYTRTDAFMEKAIKFFAPHIQDNSGGHDREYIIGEFRKYMEE